ncbi:hypothetical protein CYY_000966 [Polysphondylium violaceum]|uniref:Monalysin Pore-forming domain-containing protein n=1 Tax=Polysphondylium violaceum TaxID=133409 RepID=A0A8J4Q2N0_9MYCE|nr:hypothetical protein CYY_000966 [Polysphondylium violaceum]
MDIRGDHDKQEENVQGASVKDIFISNPNVTEEILSILTNLPSYDMSKSPVVNSNEDVALNTKHKDIPNVFLMNRNTSFSGYKPVKYEVAAIPGYPSWAKVNWNTRCKPVAVYTSFIDSKNVINQGTYSLEHRKGSSIVETWWRETTLSAGAQFKAFDVSASVTTGYKYETTFTEEIVRGWTETLEKGDYMLYQNKILYAYEIRISDRDDINYIASMINTAYDYDKSIPKAHVRGNRLFYFVDFNVNDPFFKRLSSNLYQTISFQKAVDYLMTDGWSRW